jgi:hypothetical protein
MMLKKRVLVPCLFILSALGVQAQNSAINKPTTERTAKAPITAVASTNNVVDTLKLYYVRKVPLTSYSMPVINLKDQKTKTLNSSTYITKLPKDYKLTVQLGMERKQAFAQVYIPRYINKNGQIEMLESFDLDVQQTFASQKTAGSRVYAANSVLASGTWYKVSLKNQGLYKMDYNFFKNELGINPDNIDPRKIKVYGHGGEMLAEGNAIFRHDDLPENAIEVVGENDGVFNTSDYVLFYANGPHSIIQDEANKRFTHKINIYNNDSYYFINVQGANGKRVVPQSVSAPANQSTTTANYFEYYNAEELNLGRSGKEWWSVDYSDLPGKSLTKSFSFNTPNALATAPTFVRSHVCAISSSGAN